MKANPVDRFLALFAGNLRSSGRYDPKKERAFTEYVPLSPEIVESHLAGFMGCGAVPIQDDDTCLWAAIDIDNHDSDEDIPLGPVADAIATNKLPLIACRSKSGGIHAYLFLDQPQPAARVRVLMAKWAGVLGFAGSEIFPKQGKLSYTQDKKKQLGNWINLPYFGGDDKATMQESVAKTMRYAWRDGKKLSLLEFLDLAEKMRAAESDLRSHSMSEHPDAPPCVQKMYANGVAQGQRNEALYAVSVYLRKAHPDDYQQHGISANAAIFKKALGKAEAMRTINSAGRPDYGYRCNEEPCKSLCQRDVCLTRKFGITPADADRLDTVEALPTFSDLTKYISEPVRWEFKIDGVNITNVGTEDLLDWRAVRKIIAERLTKVVPMIKNNEWERVLQPLMKEARVIETPDDASITGVIRDRLREFAGKTDLTNKGQNKEDRKALLRGMPIVQVIDAERCVVFRAQDFINYLKRTRSEELKGVSLWFAVKEAGCRHTRLRIPGAKDGEDNINVWHMPVKIILGTKPQAEAPEFESEL